MVKRRQDTHHQLWIRNEIYDILETLRVRDETVSAIIGDILAFYLEHKDNGDNE